MARPSFVVEDQSEAIGLLEKRLGSAKRIDTHGAIVFLDKDRAYKMKRAVKFPYMDFSTAERRKAMCEAEIDINRRLAPEIYLGVEPIGSDWVVVMRRFDEDGLFDRMAARGALTVEIMAALGARIAAFHDAAPPVSGFSGPDDYRQSVAADIRQLREQGDRLDQAATEALAKALPAALEPFVDIVARRAAARAVRRCHGDLHLRNIVLIPNTPAGKPVPFDAIEFSPRMASIDVLYDLAFTLMDLCERGLQPLANRLLNEWLWRIAELPEAPHETALALLPHFLSRRASVRAFVDASSAALGSKDYGPARAYQRMAVQFLHTAPPRLVAVGGLSGSGKTTRALELAPGVGRAPGAVVVRSDVERKRLAGIALEERMPAGSYTREASAKVYEAMLARAGRVLQAGYSVVLDAVHARPDERAAAEALARKLGVPFEGLWLDISREEALARVAARRRDASDATTAVVERQFGYDLGEIRWRRG
jgi:aminoglycoside phosphotransferase family enzyme/predicted kinase